MAGLTDRNLRRIERFVETPSRQRTPHILTPDEVADGEGRPTSSASDDGETEAEAETDVGVAE